MAVGENAESVERCGVQLRHLRRLLYPLLYYEVGAVFAEECADVILFCDESDALAPHAFLSRLDDSLRNVLTALKSLIFSDGVMAVVEIAIHILDDSRRTIHIREIDVVDALVNISMAETVVVQTVDQLLVIETRREIVDREIAIAGSEILVPVGWDLMASKTSVESVDVIQLSLRERRSVALEQFVLDIRNVGLLSAENGVFSVYVVKLSHNYFQLALRVLYLCQVSRRMRSVCSPKAGPLADWLSSGQVFHSIRIGSPSSSIATSQPIRSK